MRNDRVGWAGGILAVPQPPSLVIEWFAWCRWGGGGGRKRRGGHRMRACMHGCMYPCTHVALFLVYARMGIASCAASLFPRQPTTARAVLGERIDVVLDISMHGGQLCSVDRCAFSHALNSGRRQISASNGSGSGSGSSASQIIRHAPVQEPGTR